MATYPSYSTYRWMRWRYKNRTQKRDDDPSKLDLTPLGSGVDSTTVNAGVSHREKSRPGRLHIPSSFCVYAFRFVNPSRRSVHAGISSDINVAVTLIASQIPTARIRDPSSTKRQVGTTARTHRARYSEYYLQTGEHDALTSASRASAPSHTRIRLPTGSLENVTGVHGEDDHPRGDCEGPESFVPFGGL